MLWETTDMSETPEEILRALTDPERLAIGPRSRSDRRGRLGGISLGAVTRTEESVLRTFFRDGRLTEIPAKRSKRRVVFERIAVHDG
jgi:hypothetical protein